MRARRLNTGVTVEYDPRIPSTRYYEVTGIGSRGLTYSNGYVREEFEVVWQYNGENPSTWEPGEVIREDCPDIVRAFFRRFAYESTQNIIYHELSE